MNTIKINLGSEVSKVNIYPIADIHLSSKHFKRKLFEKDLETIKNDPNGYVILNGDLLNNALPSSVSDSFEELYSPEESIDILYEYLKSIKDKILGVSGGNHEARTYKHTGLRPLKILCGMLGIKDKYSSISNTTFISFGKSRGRANVPFTYVIYQTHGYGGGKMVGSKANRLHNLSNIIVNADVYIHSHTHTPIVFKDSYIMADYRNKGTQQHNRLYVNTNAYEGFGGYGEKLGLQPSNHDMIKIELTHTLRNKICKAIL